MSGWNPAANQIFLDALDIPPGDRQRAFLDQACGTDAQLRQDVEGLLRAHHEANPFPAEEVVADSKKTTPFNPAAGDFDETTVGPYRLCGLIAEGGMGVVYEAEQEQPVRRTVALKIIKPGTDSQEVIARFEIERQTLALMDHPNIASVLDAGSTKWGHPYFVMELVRGTPINTHSDVHRLGIRDRLKLFIQVCHAVQHAHQKGIIHRDHQTVQCDGHDEGWLAGAQGHRLRRGQGARSTVDRADSAHAIHPDGRDAALHES